MLARLQKAQKKDSGFTLIELLVVIVIIGILAGIAIPLFLNQREKAAEAGVKSDLRNAATYVETEYVSTNSYAGHTLDATTLRLSDPDNSVSYVSANAEGFCLTATNPEGAVFFYDSNEGGLLPEGTTGCIGTYA